MLFQTHTHTHTHFLSALRKNIHLYQKTNKNKNNPTTNGPPPPQNFMKGFLKKEDKQGWKPCPAAAISSMTWWVLSQIKHSPAVLPEGPFTLTHQTLSTAGHFSHSTCATCETPLFSLPSVLWVRGRSECLRCSGSGGDEPRQARPCVPRRPCRIRLQGPNFSPALHLARKAFSSSTRWSQDQKVCIRNGDWPLSQPGWKEKCAEGKSASGRWGAEDSLLMHGWDPP